MPRSSKSQTVGGAEKLKNGDIVQGREKHPKHLPLISLVNPSCGDESGFSHNIPWPVRGSFGCPLFPTGKDLDREVTSPSSKRSFEKSIIGKLQTWQDNFPLRAMDMESLSLSVETRAVCRIR